VNKLGQTALTIILLLIGAGYLNNASAYTISSGQTLSSISNAHSRDYRTVAQCANISNPDFIVAGSSIPDHCLTTNVSQRSIQIVSVRNTISSPNAYAYGWCTHWVKTMRPDIGSYWGDAWQWLNSARNAGYSTGYTPRVGAIAWNGINNLSPLGHVAYVESVNGNMVTVSEMAAPVWGVKSYRTVPANNFIYIY
jgi:surface antigen